MKVKEESEKAGLNKIMASGPISSWQIEGEKIEVVPDFLSSWALKSLKIVTVAVKLEDDCFLAGKL